ncbi:MAG: hypothetical protein WA398_07840, partial [Nitrososphaeraceae archaeon]
MLESTMIITVLIVLLLMFINTVQPYSMLISAENDNDDPTTFQLGNLRTCTIQETNIQGRTII